MTSGDMAKVASDPRCSVCTSRSDCTATLPASPPWSGAEEQLFSFTTQTDHPQRIFSDVIIGFWPSRFCIVRQGRPLGSGVRERLCQSEVATAFFIFSRNQLSRVPSSGFGFPLTFSKPLFRQHSYFRLHGIASVADTLWASSVRADGVRTCTSWDFT